MLADFSDKLTDEMKKSIEDGVRATRDAIGKHDAASAKQKADELAEVLKNAGIAIYSQSPQAQKPYEEVKVGGNAPPGGARPSGAGPRGRVVDADFKESN